MWSSLKRNVEQATLFPNESELHDLFKLMNMCSPNAPAVRNYNVFSLPHFLSNYKPNLELAALLHYQQDLERLFHFERDLNHAQKSATEFGKMSIQS